MQYKLPFLQDYGCLSPGLFELEHEYTLPLVDLKVETPVYRALLYPCLRSSSGFDLPLAEIQYYP